MTEQISLFSNQLPSEVDALSPETWEQIPTRASIPIPSGTYENLEQLAQHCNQCQRCDLAGGRTNVVVSRGNPNAAIMIIGEGPGQHEDEQGLPFVGKSGQLLDKILASVRLDIKNDVYICNVVKCRPPGNRAPTAGEVAACIPYLKEQVRLVDPKIILLTGGTALKGLVGVKQGITKVRGNWMEWEGRNCMAIFHPAYLLRNPSREKGKPKWLMWQDIQEIKKKLDEVNSQQA
ncbi:uracil-DNA glycosylase [Leptothoe sp. ISB3NOV94-8A]|nr:uracil-DNA glycosylase [Leptothoe sp. LEGE 181152]